MRPAFGPVNPVTLVTLRPSAYRLSHDTITSFPGFAQVTRTRQTNAPQGAVHTNHETH
jgi:hypothetical protein